MSLSVVNSEQKLMPTPSANSQQKTVLNRTAHLQQNSITNVALSSLRNFPLCCRNNLSTERYLQLVLQFAENPTKLFVGGLSWKTTSQSMRNYFKNYGGLVECSVLFDGLQRSRGFGFVKFTHVSSVVKVLKTVPHTIDGRVVDAKPSKADTESRLNGKPKLPNQYLKVFVGGLPYYVNNYDIKCFFDRHYGGVLDAAVMYCQATQTSRGFAFVQFENQTSMERVLDDRWVFIRGAKCECKPALPRIQKPLSSNGMTHEDLVSEQKELTQMMALQFSLEDIVSLVRFAR